MQPRRNFLLAIVAVAGCAESKVATTSAAGPVCSANLESTSCAAVEFRAADYAVKKVGQKYIYVVRQREGGEAWKETRKVFVVTEIARGQIALVAENRLMAASALSGIFFSSKGIEVGDQLLWPRYTIFPPTISTLAGAIHHSEIVVPAGKFSGCVEVAYRRNERPEGAKRLRINDRIVFANGVGIVRREVEAERHGTVITTKWELAAIGAPKKEE